MRTTVEPQLLRGISVYQDLEMPDGSRVAGARDCLGRWEALAPHLPPSGTFLDVGSNFGWFGLMLARTRPECVVASVEADDRTARVQHRLLKGHDATRVCLLTHKAGAGLARRFAASGQRFDAVLCLSVLHWIADHRPFLAALGPIAGRLLIEQPAPDEAGAGIARIREEIGPMDRYLADLFPDRPIDCLAEWPSHRGGPARQLWMVGPTNLWSTRPAGLEVSALLDLAPGWPNRDWWREQCRRLASDGGPGAENDPEDDRRGIWLTPQGLAAFGPGPTPSWRGLDRRLARLPADDAMTARRRMACRARRWAARLRQAWRS